MWYVAIMEREEKNKIKVKEAGTEDDAVAMRNMYSKKGWLAVIWSEEFYKQERRSGRC